MSQARSRRQPGCTLCDGCRRRVKLGKSLTEHIESASPPRSGHRGRSEKGRFCCKRICSSKRARLIQDQAQTEQPRFKIHSSRFDCCVFLFYSFRAATFATKSAISGHYAQTLLEHTVYTAISFNPKAGYGSARFGQWLEPKLSKNGRPPKSPL
jgi:hypothetical protein